MGRTGGQLYHDLDWSSTEESVLSLAFGFFFLSFSRRCAVFPMVWTIAGRMTDSRLGSDLIEIVWGGWSETVYMTNMAGADFQQIDLTVIGGEK